MGAMRNSSQNYKPKNKMFTLKAKTGGQIDFAQFDLSKITSEAMTTAEDRDKHNNEVYSKFQELIVDYYTQLNQIFRYDLGIHKWEGSCSVEWENVNKHITPHHICHYGSRLESTYKFGHGSASIEIRFTSPHKGSWFTYDFKGVVRVVKDWARDDKGGRKLCIEEYPLESVKQVVEVSADVIKYFIIARDVRDFSERQKLLTRELPYESKY
jgi:hypothetical protein